MMKHKNKDLHRWMHGFMDIEGAHGELYTPTKIKRIARRTLRAKNSDPAKYASFKNTVPSVLFTQDFS